MRNTGLLLFLLTLLATSFLPRAAAQEPSEDPPGRVARLNYIQGSLSYQVSGDQNWIQANPNRPLTTGDNLWADENSRGEVHIGSTAIRMGSVTGISFLTLDDRTVQLQLAQGTIEVHLRRLAAGEAFEIDTPNLALTLERSGEYRIEADPSGEATKIIVREGTGEVIGAGDSWELTAGQAYEFRGKDALTYDAYAAPPFDDFEDWCQSRDARENQALSAKYVSRDVDGYYDLDDYGDWQPAPEYGMIWVPRSVLVGWVPYHYGHWVYIAPWGWTWVDDAPWGFAPFHYGRWVLISGTWGWVPGPVVVRPVYAPALVAFVGGGGFSFSVAFGGGFSGVAWFPLGPHDVYVPGFHCSPHYVQNINITNTRVVNVTQVTNVYNTVVVNRNVTAVNYMYAKNGAAVTAVSRETFVNARPVSTAAVHVSSEQIETARAVDTAPIAPTRSSYIASTAKVATTKPTVPFAQRPVVARLTPAVSRSAPVYTNESRPFNQHPSAQPSHESRSDNAKEPQPSRDNFRPFTPPGEANATAAAAGNKASNATAEPYHESPPVHYTPAPKARDDMYDVHPPLNQNQKPVQPPKQESHKEETKKPK
ncbi:MAG TPA: DUF6600 domain-containing protein [Candidatus Acidoferrum sp.]|nr:DUF6600 domain-containing protein [Candidatus Acidoferrum sp.]